MPFLLFVALKENITDMLLPSIIQEVRLNGNSLVGLEKDVSPKLLDRLNARAGVANVRRKPCFVVLNAFENASRPEILMSSVRNPLNANSLAVGFPGKLQKIVNYVTTVNIIHVTHERV